VARSARAQSQEFIFLLASAGAAGGAYGESEGSRVLCQLCDMHSRGLSSRCNARSLDTYAAVQTYQFCYVFSWHLGSLAVLFYGGCMCAQGQMSYAQLTAAYLYSDHVFDSSKVVCEQVASVLENIGTVDTVLKYALGGTCATCACYGFVDHS
jgi:hypothetical protein